MRKCARLCTLALLACSALRGRLGAQAPAAAPGPTVRAGAVRGAIRVDGVLDEDAWREAGVIADLVQQAPRPGEPTPYRTEVRILADSESLYFGITCVDPEPGRIAVHTMQRDGDMEGSHRGDKVNLTRFTIDYSLCIFCDLCTLACPDKQVCIHMGKEFDLTSYEQSSLVKNLLTDLPFTKDDRMKVLEHRSEIDRLEEEKKKAKAVAAKAAAEKAAAAKAAAAAAPKTEEKKTPPAPDAPKPEDKK